MEQMPLFPAANEHDPGGKVRTALPSGVRGADKVSECGKFRQMLSRDWTPKGNTPRSILWLGMNPSTALADVSDSTVTREYLYSRDWGYTRYLKGNVLDYRATKPKDIPHNLNEARSEENLRLILEMAAESEMVLMGYGKLHKRYSGIVEETVSALRATGLPIMCLAKNLDGSAKHPLYLRKDLLPIPFD
jgi:hypothetical protein